MQLVIPNHRLDKLHHSIVFGNTHLVHYSASTLVGREFVETKMFIT